MSNFAVTFAVGIPLSMRVPQMRNASSSLVRVAAESYITDRQTKNEENNLYQV